MEEFIAVTTISKGFPPRRKIFNLRYVMEIADCNFGDERGAEILVSDGMKVADLWSVAEKYDDLIDILEKSIGWPKRAETRFHPLQGKGKS